MSINLTNIKTIVLDLPDLLLDPNNLRFSQDIEIKENMIEDEDIQQETYDLMNNEHEGYQINQLERSIMKNGFSNIDDLWVKKISNSNKYYVVEGNRRITALKNLLNKEERIADFEIGVEVKNTFKEITCKDLSRLEQDDINILLGFKHMGGQLDWKAFPISQALFKEYVKELYQEGLSSGMSYSDYRRNTKITKAIAERFSLTPANVNNACASYRIYHQISPLCIEHSGKEFDPKQYFGRIYEGLLKLTEVKRRYNFNITDGTISEEGIEEFIKLNIGSHEAEPVITSTSTGDSSFRDFNWVLKNDDGDEEYIRMIVEVPHEKTSKVKALLQSTLKEESIKQKLKISLKQLEAIEAGEMRDDLSNTEIDYLKNIIDLSNRILKFSNNE